MKKLLFIIILGFLFGCSPDSNIKQGYTKEISYDSFSKTHSGLVLTTKAYYQGVVIYSNRVNVTLETNDSIKCIRYNTAKKWIEQFRRLDNIKCD